jgi:hypothetical protein
VNWRTESNDLIKNRSSVPACTVVPQPIALPRVPVTEKDTRNCEVLGSDSGVHIAPNSVLYSYQHFGGNNFLDLQGTKCGDSTFLMNVVKSGPNYTASRAIRQQFQRGLILMEVRGTWLGSYVA